MTQTPEQDESVPRPDVPYWEDSVYRYLSRQHHASMAADNTDESSRLDALMEELISKSMPDDLYWELDEEAREDKKERKKERKDRSKRPPDAGIQGPGINTADLKKRIFNPNVTRENVIKALEALPPAEKKATIAGLPPGLRRKLGTYLKSR